MSPKTREDDAKTFYGECACSYSATSRKALKRHQAASHKLLDCGHQEGTFEGHTEGFEGVKYCSRCGSAVDAAAWAQAFANKLNAPVLGQLVGMGTFEPQPRCSICGETDHPASDHTAW